MKSAIIVLAALVCASCRGGAPNQSPGLATPDSSSSQSVSSPNPTPSSTPSAPSYHIIEIPRLAPSGSVTASAVNDQGIVVGNQETSTSPRAWMYQQSSGALDELTFDPSETGASANGISNSGMIAGYAIDANSASLQAGFWTVTGGAMLLGGEDQNFTQATAVNDSGTLVGIYAPSGTVSSQALVWSGPEYAEATLAGLPCDMCAPIMISANAVNDGGEIVGSSSASVSSNGQYVSGGVYAVEWRSGTVTSLGGLQGAAYSAAYGVDSGGDIVGGSRVGESSGAPSHAFLYAQGAMRDLGTLPGDTDSSAASINDTGQIVGQSENTAADDTSRAFLYEHGRMYDLNALIVPTDPLAGSVTLEDAVGISSNGRIAVNGTDANDPGWQRAFLLVPSG